MQTRAEFLRSLNHPLLLPSSAVQECSVVRLEIAMSTVCIENELLYIKVPCYMYSFFKFQTLCFKILITKKSSTFISTGLVDFYVLTTHILNIILCTAVCSRIYTAIHNIHCVSKKQKSPPKYQHNFIRILHGHYLTSSFCISYTLYHIRKK